RTGASLGERPWGRWTVLHRGEGYQVKLLEVRPGQRLSLQFHRHRSEIWVKVAGTAQATVGDRSFDPAPLQPVVIPVGEMHRLGNPGKELLRIIEVQQGDWISEDDIVRLEDDYRRAPVAANEPAQSETVPRLP
ncbi:MAG: phosphomannose isomerase type II C-terminal cupin domain, partial [Gammaproteobacteria bacterium]